MNGTFCRFLSKTPGDYPQVGEEIKALLERGKSK
jgi:hypothetical protein